MDNPKLKDIILRKRKSLGITQNDIADLLGISQTSYHKLEKGKTLLISEHLQKLCEILGISTSELLSDEEALYGGTSTKEAHEFAISEYLDLLKLKEEEIKLLKSQLDDKVTIANLLSEKMNSQEDLIKLLKERISKLENKAD